MNSFEELQREWKKRPFPATPEQGDKQVIEKAKYLSRKQTILQIVLGLTVVILVLFFFYVSAYRNSQVFTGLGIMIGCLVIRIVTEIYFRVQKKNFPFQEVALDFESSVLKYYRSRKYIHYVLTPILFSGYILGFVMLLPSFQQSLSRGFFHYIIGSSVVIFVGLGWVIFTQVKKELGILRELSGEEEEI